MVQRLNSGEVVEDEAFREWDPHCPMAVLLPVKWQADGYNGLVELHELPGWMWIDDVQALIGVMQSCVKLTFSLEHLGCRDSLRLAEALTGARNLYPDQPLVETAWQALRMEALNDPDGDGGLLHRDVGANGRKTWPLLNVRMLKGTG